MDLVADCAALLGPVSFPIGGSLRGVGLTAASNAKTETRWSPKTVPAFSAATVRPDAAPSPEKTLTFSLKENTYENCQT